MLGAGTSAVDVTMLRSSWPTVISHLRSQGKAVLPSFLEIATPAAFDGQTLELVFPPDRPYGVQKVVEREGELRQALQDLFGVAPAIRCVVREPVAGPPEPVARLQHDGGLQGSVRHTLLVLGAGLLVAREARAQEESPPEAEEPEPIEVHVVADQAEAIQKIPGSFTVVDKKELERAGPVNTAEMLRRVPGVTVREETAGGNRIDIGVRGLDPGRSRRVLVLEDTHDRHNISAALRTCEAFGVQDRVRYSGVIEMPGLPTRPKLKNAAPIPPEEASANPTEDHPIVEARIRQAARRGARLIVIDPRRIELTSDATCHLALRPGTNVALLNAMAQVIVTEGLCADDFLQSRVDGADVHLTPTEFDLLAYLAARPGVVCTRERLLAEVWGYADGSGPRTVDSHVRALRRKLGASAIRTVHGVGYACADGDA